VNRYSTVIEQSLHIGGMNEKIMFAERLKAALEAAGYEARPSVLEREFNLRYWGKPITFQAVRRWLRGDSIPSQDKLQVLARWLLVDPHHLRYGASTAYTVSEPSPSWDVSSTNEERQLLSLYRELPAAQRKVVREIIETFAKVHPPGNGRND
jgi:transcriptional regulator with XRE-family HTH domain|tara:strand:- start:9 stop:467 length:459 start_codon:yes stop_codon:yes gene_type:complete